MMWNIFKSKKEKSEIKSKNLQEELEDFIKKYKDYFNCYAFAGTNIIIYKEPQIKNDKLVLRFIVSNTPKGYSNYDEIWCFQLKYGENFLEEHRTRFLKLKTQLEQLGLKLESI